MAGSDVAPRAAGQAAGQEALINEIDQAREDLARTIDAITDKVRPANVARRTADTLKERAQALDPKLVAAGAAVAVGLVGLIIWRRRR